MQTMRLACSAGRHLDRPPRAAESDARYLAPRQRPQPPNGMVSPPPKTATPKIARPVQKQSTSTWPRVNQAKRGQKPQARRAVMAWAASRSASARRQSGEAPKARPACVRRAVASAALARRACDRTRLLREGPVVPRSDVDVHDFVFPISSPGGREAFRAGRKRRAGRRQAFASC